MGIFSRPKKDALIAVFDITSSSVGGLLSLHHPDNLPEILSASRFPTDFFPDFDFQKYQRSFHRTFERNINYLRKFMPKGREKPDLAVIVFSSPYYISQTKIVRFSKPKPFEITKHLLEVITDDEINSLKRKWQKEHAQLKAEVNIETIEHERFKVNLNGYPVLQPIGKRVQNLELPIFMSLGIKAVHDKLQECILHSFGQTPVRFQSFPFVAFQALKDIIDITKGLLLIDIGGEITDLILIRNSILEETISFPLGENFLIRRIASVFHFSLEESSALLNQYTRGDLHDETSDKVRKVIEDASGRWCQFLNESLKGISESSLAPRSLLFIGGKAAFALKDFAPCVKEQTFTSQLLLPEAFKKHFIFRKGFSEDKDILLMISALYVDKLFLNL